MKSFPLISAEDRQSLIDDCNEEIKRITHLLQWGKEREKLTAFAAKSLNSQLMRQQISLAALKAEPIAMLCKYDGEPWGHFYSDNYEPGSDAFLAPALTTLRLPESIQPDDVPRIIDSTANPDEYARCVGKDVWDACLAEVKRMNGVKS